MYNELVSGYRSKWVSGYNISPLKNAVRVRCMYVWWRLWASTCVHDIYRNTNWCLFVYLKVWSGDPWEHKRRLLFLFFHFRTPSFFFFLNRSGLPTSTRLSPQTRSSDLHESCSIGMRRIENVVLRIDRHRIPLKWITFRKCVVLAKRTERGIFYSSLPARIVYSCYKEISLNKRRWDGDCRRYFFGHDSFQEHRWSRLRF